MRQLITLTLLLCATNIFGQITNSKVSGVIIAGSDTVLRVEYFKKQPLKPNTKFFINNVLVDEYIVGDLEPELISNVDVNNNQVHVNTKNDWLHKPITLTALKAKVTNLPDTAAVLFMLHGRIINDDYDKYIVNEKLFSKMIVEPMDHTNKANNITVICLLTPAEERAWNEKYMIIR
ncbi:hypothetical protein [Pinibacter soli]|uniref:Uncharacterized protein n=1 Tax=Pinibacter soli TaxID=3044211 RepID=A0ABT6R7E0_9BACT|nr:hypothetical protein [Pinibacter soli]MDI3318488.1 hypothetical protein [Pinibacter soli]